MQKHTTRARFTTVRTEEIRAKLFTMLLKRIQYLVLKCVVWFLLNFIVFFLFLLVTLMS